jgi:4-amino-4-deoxy-L-arabinose transferase-like glycosyltransferase
LSAGVQVPPTVHPRVSSEAGGFPREAGLASSVLPLYAGVYYLIGAALLIHFAFNGRFGYFRDELYYAACGQHFSWGYVDHAPLAPWLAQLSRSLLGDSLFALRFLPALAASAKVFLAAWIARELGGGKFAQFLASLTVLAAPIYLTFDNFFSMNSFEPVFWMTCAAIVLRILNGGDAPLWLLFGLVAGLGILNKHSMLFFGSGIALGLLFTPARRQYASRWIWAGAAVSFFLFLPNLLWEIRNGWPTIALLQSVMGTKYAVVSPWEYIWQQSLLTNPLAAPIWLAGLWYLFRDPAGKKYAVLGWAYLTVLGEMLLLHGKIYYLAPAYVMLLAAGAVWIEFRLLPRTGSWLKPVIVWPLLTGAIIAAPLAMPIFPVDTTIRYTRFWDVKAVRVENVPQGDLPQLFGDMFGWPEQVAGVASVYNRLPSTVRARAAILAYNYGEASAIDYFGRRYALPKSISGHNQYGLWGPRNYSGELVIAIGFTESRLREFFAEVTPAAVVSPRYAMPEETNLTIFICRGPKTSLQESWAQWKYLN